MQHRSTLLLVLILTAGFTSCQDSARVTKVINSDAKAIARLEKRISIQTEELSELQQTRAALTEITSKQEELSNLLDNVEAQFLGLKSSISDLELSFEGYRTSYRHMTWQNAVGEHYPKLSKTNGETYTDVKIKQITPVGIEITHTDGLARIRHTDLDSSFKKRFQWTAAEASKILRKEAKSAALVSQNIENTTTNTRTRKSSDRRLSNTSTAQRKLARQTKSRPPKRGVNTLKLGKKTGGG